MKIPMILHNIFYLSIKLSLFQLFMQSKKYFKISHFKITKKDCQLNRIQVVNTSIEGRWQKYGKQKNPTKKASFTSLFSLLLMLKTTSGDLIFLKLVFLLNDRLKVCSLLLNGGVWALLALSEIFLISANDELDDAVNRSWLFFRLNLPLSLPCCCCC